MGNPVCLSRCCLKFLVQDHVTFSIFQDDNKDKDGGDDVTYADLDKTAMNGGKTNNGSTVSIETDENEGSRTEYAEIQPSKK